MGMKRRTLVRTVRFRLPLLPSSAALRLGMAQAFKRRQTAARAA